MPGVIASRFDAMGKGKAKKKIDETSLENKEGLQCSLLMSVSSSNTLNTRLHEHSNHFNRLIELLPASVYLPRNEEDERRLVQSKFAKHKSNKAPKQEVKEASKKALKARLDPATRMSAVDVQRQEVATANNVANISTTKVKSLKRGAEAMDDDDDSDDDDDDDGDDDDDDTMVGRKDGESIPTVRRIGADSSTVELRERLRDRIDELQRNRNANDDNVKRAKKANKRKDAKKAKADAAKVKRQKTEATNTAITLAGGESAKLKEGEKRKSSAALSAVAVGDGQMVFSKFDFGKNDDGKKKTKKNYEHLLAKAEANKERLLQLKASGHTEKAATIEQNQKWNKAFEQSEGVKHRDDAKLLKKTIKREEKKKDKSAKVWQDRTENLIKSKAEQQKKRAQNLKERSLSKRGMAGYTGKSKAGMKNKFKKSGKKVIKRAGFEGRA